MYILRGIPNFNGFPEIPNFRVSTKYQLKKDSTRIILSVPWKAYFQMSSAIFQRDVALQTKKGTQTNCTNIPTYFLSKSFFGTLARRGIDSHAQWFIFLTIIK